MRKSKTRMWIKIFGLSVIGIGLIIGTAYVSKALLLSLEVDNNSYVLRDIAEDLLPVSKTEEKTLFQKPFDDSEVKIHINYYETSDSREDQEKSLILYENTYMPNTGILYGSEKSYDVLAAFDGDVIDVLDDEIFGKIVIVKHNNDLVTKYSSLSSSNVKVGDAIRTGDIIGQSGSNKIASISQNMLLFEVIKNGNNDNPENYYGKTIDEMR